MKKKIFISYWFYFFGGFVMIAMTLGLTIFGLMQIITVPKEVNPTMVVSYWMFPFLVLMTIFMIFAAGYVMFQFTILTKDGVKVRCVWCTIRELKWEEVKEVRLERFYVSVQGGFTSKWYLFDDGVERKFTNGIAGKKSHITLPYSKKAEKALKEFWKGEIIEKIETHYDNMTNP